MKLTNYINQERFSTPDMGDYYDEELIEEYLKCIEEQDPNGALYYLEDPYKTDLGYDEEQNVFVLKATPVIKKYDTKEDRTGEEYEELNYIDGDTIGFYLDSVNDGGKTFKIDGVNYSSFKDYVYRKCSFQTFKEKIFMLRMIGIDAPEIPHFKIIIMSDEEAKDNIVTIPVEEIESSNYVYIVNKIRTEKEYKFMKIGDTYNEILIDGTKEYPFKNSKMSDGLSEVEGDNFKYYIVLSKDESRKEDVVENTDMGNLAKVIAVNALSNASDMRIVLDVKQLSTSVKYSDLYKLTMNGWNGDYSFWEYIKAMFQKAFGVSRDYGKYIGFTYFGQDSYKRLLGCIYIKISLSGQPEKWINLGKYIKYKVGDSVKIIKGSSPDLIANNNYSSDAFKLWTYDNKNSVIADGFYNINKPDFDDRRQIQKEITGLDYSYYKDFTVMIGDCLFMVPPTSIRVVNQINSTRVPILRSKGSIMKESPHNNRIIELTLYFNGDCGINGIPIKKQLPIQKGTNEYETYYMNGLRTLISMFKFTPFLPIENEYINNILNIEAVALADLQIQTMPSYPKCLSVKLSLQDFNYRIYLNDLPVPNESSNEKYTTNMFARTINYGVMRYYYQRAIQQGEKFKNIDPTSQEFIENTMGNKTKLMPMNFKDQTIKFQVLDEEWLDKMKQIKILAQKQVIQQNDSLTDAAKKWFENISNDIYEICNFINNKEESITFGKTYKTMEELIDEYVKDFSDKIKRKCTTITRVYNNSADYIENHRLKIEFDKSLLSETEIKNVMKIIYKEIYSNEYTKYENNYYISDKDFYILTEAESSKDNGYSLYKVRFESKELEQVTKFIAYRSNKYILSEENELDTNGWDFPTNGNEDLFEKIKDSGIDTETILSAKFKEYPLEIVTQQFSIGMSNALSNITLKSQEGFAPQYTGGQDTIIDFNFYTKDENTVTLLNAIQKMTAKQLIDYNSIMKCCPVRIDSELTRLCGVYEIILETVDIATVPNQPGLFLIQCRAISLDRTMRNKEALNRLDAINNAGSINPQGIGANVYKTYFDLNNTLQKAEVYPDLELPTINELESTGYKFIRYANKKTTRLYPDPDFYFVYGYVYSSQALRKVIIDFFKDSKNNEGNEESSFFNKTKSIFYQYGSSQSVETSISDDNDNILSYKYKNETEYNEWNKKRELFNTTQNTENIIDEISDNEKMTLNDYNGLLYELTNYSWDVCTGIKCIFPGGNSYKEDYIKNKIDEVNKKLLEIINCNLENPLNASNYRNFDLSKDITLTQKIINDEYSKQLINSIENYIDNECSNGYLLAMNTLFKGEIGELKKPAMASFLAAAIAQSGETEYSEKLDDDFNRYKYRPRNLFIESTYNFFNDENIKTYNDILKKLIPYSLTKLSSGNEYYNASSFDDAIKNGITFGPFQIKKYSKEFLTEFYSSDEDYKDIVFTEDGFLDPYYNKDIAISKSIKLEDSEIDGYKEKIILSPEYAVASFGRIILVWIKKLIKENIYTTYYDSDIRDNTKELAETMIQKLYDEKRYNNMDENTVKDEIQVLNEYIARESYYEKSIFAGKIFLPILCAVIDGDETIYNNIRNFNVGELTSRTALCQQTYTPNSYTNADRKFRRLLKGLCDKEYKLCTDFSAIGAYNETNIEALQQSEIEKLWFDICNDPSKWVQHSFYDMVVNNKRGRMCRAFPTYYMILIDEGREIGYWKLHDNFYNMSAISEIEVTKSRKIPADTAKIVMTNMFKTYTTDDTDIKVNYSHNIRDAWNSIFSPRKYFEEAEETRINQLNINQARIKPGARIHLRMGYSGDASSLPILFNGIVAEVGTGELLEVIAQGDGHELSNTQVFAGVSADDASEVKNESSLLRWVYNFMDTGSTPRNLIKSILTTKGGIIRTYINKFTNGRFFNDNMFGIVHFGEIDYKEVHSNGEVMQNIYEGEGGMPWQSEETSSRRAFDKNPPNFTIKLKDKSVWDILNTCASSSLDFIVGIAPFGLRSTIFHGRPHYYYAYDYEINENGLIVEKRKPFQQFHMIDSYSDIIGNNLKASGTDVKTVVVPSYTGPTILNSEELKTLEPLYADIDIFPEFQKTMVLDTGMQWKGLTGLFIYNKFRDEWSNKGGEKIAWRMGANALKNSFRDMYKGEVIIIGDTTIKPYDRINLYDIYENMSGPFEVEAVVHRLSPETGFTSSIYADCISCIDNRYTQCASMFTKEIFSNLLLFKSISWSAGMAFGTTTKPMLSVIANTSAKFATTTTKILQKAASYVGFNDLFKNFSSDKIEDIFRKAINPGMTKESFEALGKISNISRWKDGLSLIKMEDIKTTTDIIDNLENTLKVINGKDPNTIHTMLGNIVNDTNISAKGREEIAGVISELYNNKLTYIKKNNLNKAIEKLNEATVKHLKGMSNLDDATKEAIKILESYKEVNGEKAINESLKALRRVEGFAADNMDDIARLAFNYTDDVTKAMGEMTKIIGKTDLTKSILSKSLKGIGKAIFNIPNLITMTVIMTMEYIIEKSIYNWVENVLASLNVLTVFPLKKNGVAYVAGIDGHKGLVVGSPTWGSSGLIDEFAKWAFKDSDGIIRGILDTFVISEQAKEIVSYYTKENRLGDYCTDEQSTLYNLLNNVNEEEASSNSSYNAMISSERITDINTKDATYTFSISRVQADIDEISGNDIIINELVLINSSNPLMKQYYDNTDRLRLRTVYDYNKKTYNSSGEKVETKLFEINGIKNINGFVVDKKEGKQLIHLPYLRQDCIEVFKIIFNKLIDNIDKQRYGEDKIATLWITEALVVNSNNFYSTGYEFSFSVEINDEIIKKSLDETKEYIKKQIVKSGYKEHPVFDYKRKTNSWEILVYPRNQYKNILLK